MVSKNLDSAKKISRRLLLSNSGGDHKDINNVEKKKKIELLNDWKPESSVIEKFQRYKPIDLQNEKNVRRRRHLKKQQRLNDEAVRRLAAFNTLLTESPGFLEVEPNEKTFAIKQRDILDQLDVGSQAKAWKLNLSGGPFLLDYTKNGRYLLSGGHSYGNLSIIDCLTLTALTEVHVNEVIRDVCFLHNETMWAAAQKKYVYIYDNQGLELHCLREHMMTYRIEFLPHHYLLTTIGEFGQLRYLDISTGLVAAAHKTNRGPCDTICQNPFTGVINLGHVKGAISMWTPNIGKPVVEFLAHGGKVMSLCHLDTNYLASAGLDGCCKIWDIRRFQQINSFRYFGSAPKAMDASQNGGILGLGFGSHVQFWKDLTNTSNKPRQPYLTHEVPGNLVSSLKFRPYEDFCCLGFTSGLETIVVPGSGLANYHSHTADPYETTKQRHEKEIHSLLDKLPPETITYDPTKLGLIDKDSKTVTLEEEEAETFNLREEKQKKVTQRRLKKLSSVTREKLQKKLYADLVRKKNQRRLREEKAIRAKDEANISHAKQENDQSDVQHTTSSASNKENYDCLQRFRKTKKN